MLNSMLWRASASYSLSRPCSCTQSSLDQRLFPNEFFLHPFLHATSLVPVTDKTPSLRVAIHNRSLSCLRNQPWLWMTKEGTSGYAVPPLLTHASVAQCRSCPRFHPPAPLSTLFTRDCPIPRPLHARCDSRHAMEQRAHFLPAHAFTTPRAGWR